MDILRNNRGIARIVKPGPDGLGEMHVGMAFVVGARHVMTCCHVLNDALGRRIAFDPERPPAETWFSIRFPYASNANGSGRVVRWGFELGQAQRCCGSRAERRNSGERGPGRFQREVEGKVWFCIGWDDSDVPRGAQGEFGPILPDHDNAN